MCYFALQDVPIKKLIMKNHPLIKEENYATYADWVEDEMLMIDHYLEISDKELADIKKDAMNDPEYFREFVESFNEQIEGLLQEGK